MSDKVVTVDEMPDGWIKKQSKRHPDHFYYYNTVTRKSQWTSPNRLCKPSTSKRPAESPKGNDRNDAKSFKISNNSKLIKKNHSKTPAQDRLQKFAEQLKESPTKFCSGNVVEKLKNATAPLCRVPDFVKSNRNEPEKINVIKKTNGTASRTVNVNVSKLDDVHNVKTSVNIIRQSPIVRTPHKSVNEIIAPKTTDDIPRLFPPRTPGQNRLNRLRCSLNPENESTPSESAQLSLSVIQSEFGLAPAIPHDNNGHNTAVDEEEPMDWEPCDIFEQVENNVYNELKRTYIVPDTNVLLDELSCIRDTIRRDTKYNVLVPFVVLQELDRLKSRTGDSRISNLASGAIRFIFNELKSKTQRLQGQKATEDCSPLIDVANADDKILNCCLQQLHKSSETILISNDINLCNKAIASGITTKTSKEYKADHN